MSDKFQILRDFKNEYGKPDKTIEEFAYELIEENKELKNLNDKLSSALESAENRIDKAIDYIEGSRYENRYSNSTKNVNKLLEILKGDK